MIISASRRTDIPAFYGDKFMKNLESGFACVKNPFNPNQVSKVSLAKDDVDCFVFWTKDAQNFIKHLDKIDSLGYKYYFLFTLTPYGKDVEVNLRDKKDIIKTFQELSVRIGKEKLIWRYDPIIIGNGIDVAYHIKMFKRMCELLASYTETVIFSFLLEYKKIGKQTFRRPNENEIKQIGDEFAKIAKEHNIKIKTCAEEIDFNNGIERASCIDKELIERIIGRPVKADRDTGQRPKCRCVKSRDIGEYNTCKFGCKYCYAK